MLTPRILAVSLALAGTALAAPASATDGYILHGTGAKAKGAGGVAIAMPQEATAIASNPATATALGHEVAIGVDIFVPDRGASISGNGAGLNGDYSGNGANPFVLGDAAWVRPVSDTVSLGLAVVGNGGMNTVYEDNPFAAFGGTGDAGVDLKQVTVLPTVAVEVAPGHSLGISGIGLVQTFRATGLQPFAGFSADPAAFTDRGTDWSFGAGVRVGYYGEIGDRLAVGAFYQSKIKAGAFDKYAGLFADGGDFDVPASWGAGVSVKATDRLTLGADYKRIEYSGVNSVGNSVASLFAGVPFGAEDGPGFGWEDISVVKVGAVYRASDTLALRAGYGRAENPVPAGETLLNILAPGVVEDHFTAGASVRLSPSMELSAHVLHAPKNAVAGSGSIPMAFGGGEADIRLAETSVGLALGFSL